MSINTRRDFITKVGIGTAGLVMMLPESNPLSAPALSRVHIIGGVTETDRRTKIYELLEPFREEIAGGISGKQIYLKPNVVDMYWPLAVTHLDTLRGVLDFLNELTDQKIYIGESSTYQAGGTNDTDASFSYYGYPVLANEYNVEFVDFDDVPSTTVQWISDFNQDNKIAHMNIANPRLDPNNYFFSIANMKIHGRTVCTLTVKNFIMSSPPSKFVVYPENLPAEYVARWINTEKDKMHLGAYRGLNYNIVRVARHIHPNFAILDGTVGMEGEGPTHGTPVNHGVMVAGPDFVSVDRIGLELMGLDYNMVKIVQYCSSAGVGQGELDQIEIIGDTIDQYRREYRLHSKFAESTAYIAHEPAQVAEFQKNTNVADDIPSPFLLLSNFPNPFNISTTIEMTLSTDSNVTLSIFSINGQKVCDLSSSFLQAGTYVIRWNGRDHTGLTLASGPYYLRAVAGKHTVVHHMTLLK